jgi:hypothetical protein
MNEPASRRPEFTFTAGGLPVDPPPPTGVVPAVGTVVVAGPKLTTDVVVPKGTDVVGEEGSNGDEVDWGGEAGGATVVEGPDGGASGRLSAQT